MSDVLYIPEMAAKLGMTEAALRSHLQRDTAAVPRPFKLGRRLAWRRQSVDAWLEEQAEGRPKKKAGRPRQASPEL